MPERGDPLGRHRVGSSTRSPSSSCSAWSPSKKGRVELDLPCREVFARGGGGGVGVGAGAVRRGIGRARRVLGYGGREPGRGEHSGCGFVKRSVVAGYLASSAAGRMGRRARSPPQLGQGAPNRVSAQSAQNVHSYVQIRARSGTGGRSRSQHSQFGRSSSMARNLSRREAFVSRGRVPSVTPGPTRCWSGVPLSGGAGGATSSLRARG